MTNEIKRMIKEADKKYRQEMKENHPVRYYLGRARKIAMWGIAVPTVCYFMLTTPYREAISFEEDKGIHKDLVESKARVNLASRQRNLDAERKSTEQYQIERFEYYIELIAKTNRLIGQYEGKNKLEGTVQ